MSLRPLAIVENVFIIRSLNSNGTISCRVLHKIFNEEGYFGGEFEGGREINGAVNIEMTFHIGIFRR
jgi:hypothetical protein